MSILHQCTVSPTLVSRDSHRPLPFWPCGTKDLSPQICYPSTPTNLKSQSRFVPLKFNIALKKSNFRRQSSKKMRKGGPQMFPTEFPTQNLQPKKNAGMQEAPLPGAYVTFGFLFLTALSAFAFALSTFCLGLFTGP